MVEERLKLALRLKLGQLNDDVAVAFAWAAQDLARRKRRLTAWCRRRPLEFMAGGGLPAVVGSAISTGGRTIMRVSWLTKGLSSEAEALEPRFASV
jgi:hypothetical protein